MAKIHPGPSRPLLDGQSPLAGPIMLAWAGAVMMIIVAGFMAFGLIVALRLNDFADAQVNIEKLAVVLAHDIESSIRNTRRALDDMVEDVDQLAIEDADGFAERVATHALYQRLRQRIVALPQLDSLSFLDRDGTIRLNSRSPTYPPINHADRDYFQALRDTPGTDLYVGVPVFKPEHGTRNFFLARRLQARGGGFLGVAVAVLNLTSYQEFFRRIDTGDGMAYTLWRDVGVMIARYPPPADGEVDFETVRANHARLLADNGEHGTERYVGGVAREPLLVTLRRVPDLPLYITVSIPERTLLATWRREAVAIALGALLFSLGIGVGASVFVRKVRGEQRLIDARADRDRAVGELQRMTTLNRAKNDFMAHMSHELRTPLNAVIGFADILRNEVFGPLGAGRYRDYAADIHAAGQALLSLVNDILTFSAASEGRLRIEARRTDAGAAAKAAQKLLQVVAERRGVGLEVQVAPGLPAITGDDDRLRQVLLNLVGNALKFTQPGGVVRIAALHRDATVALVVEDTGCGMTAEILAGAFEPFGRTHRAAVSEPDRGFGLGLPITKLLTERMGGTIAIDSAPGAGTRVTVAFPAALEPVAIAAPRTARGRAA